MSTSMDSEQRLLLQVMVFRSLPPWPCLASVWRVWLHPVVARARPSNLRFISNIETAACGPPFCFFGGLQSTLLISRTNAMGKKNILTKGKKAKAERLALGNRLAEAQV